MELTRVEVTRVRNGGKKRRCIHLVLWVPLSEAGTSLGFTNHSGLSACTLRIPDHCTEARCGNAFRCESRKLTTGSRFHSSIYIAFPEEAKSPPRVLKGFHTIHLQPDETKDVTFELSRRDLSIWGVIARAWVAPAPDVEYTLHVRRSSRDLQLTGILML